MLLSFVDGMTFSTLGKFTCISGFGPLDSRTGEEQVKVHGSAHITLFLFGFLTWDAYMHSKLRSLHSPAESSSHFLVGSSEHKNRLMKAFH